MILLEFRYPDMFRKASAELGGHQIRYVAEPSNVSFQPSLIYMFEENLRTDPQRQALSRARGFEATDRVRQRSNSLPNLAVPQ